MKPVKCRALGGLALVACAIALRSAAAEGSLSDPATTVWFDQPAQDFTESSPMGNGRLGAMLFGGVDEDRIVLNESSMWSGSPQDADRPDAYKALPEIQRLLSAGKNPEAESLVNANFTCRGRGSGGARYGCYQVLGNLHLFFLHQDTNAAVSGYRRVLSLADAVTAIQYHRGAVTFKREMFVSAPDQVMVLQLTTDKAKQISFDLRLDRPERFQTTADGQTGLSMRGQLDNGTDGKGLRYDTRIRVLAQDGQVFTPSNCLSVRQASSVVLLIAAATDYQGFTGRRTKDPVAATARDLDLAARKSLKALLRAHIADYRRYFDRVALHLQPVDESAASRPTPQRVAWARVPGGDPNLAALYFNFGRYLLISSSRPGGFPANLQGIWAEEVHTPWNGDWHLDVNVEMNYWPAEECNLSDLTQPLFALIASLQAPGAKTAHDYYNAHGWVAHVITNPWGFTSPGESASWGATTSGSGWLCQHLWDHWLFTHDKRFLAWAYPIMKGAAQFYSDLLVEDPESHYLVTAPASSPENSFTMQDGRRAAISLGSTFQNQIIRYLFTACINSSDILGVDREFRNDLISKRARLEPTRIGPDGRVMEWSEPYQEPEPHHRHVSHLWGLYPGDEITPARTPDLAQAARRTLMVRGDDGVGWSLAFKAALWARLGDGDHAWALVCKALAPAQGMDIRYDGGGGVYPNLFDACPPFQIDANFGVAAAIGEMLLQSGESHPDGDAQGADRCVIDLLPALPGAWPNGSFQGFRARGGFGVGCVWRDGKLVLATIRSSSGGSALLRYGKAAHAVKLGKNETFSWSGQ